MAVFRVERTGDYTVMSNFHLKDKWMVNHSARVIAVYNGEAGGTRNTIVYANKHDVDVINVCE